MSLKSSSSIFTQAAAVSSPNHPQDTVTHWGADDYTFIHDSSFSLSTSSQQQEPLNLVEFYSDKTLLCTGCTGFLGKAMIEKFLRSVPTVKKIYVLIREKVEKSKQTMEVSKVTSPQERLISEIIKSPIMDRLIQEQFHGNRELFEDYALSKLEAVGGDVTEDGLLSQSTKEKIEQVKAQVQIMIHSAATIGFTERLDNAIKLNTYGALRCLTFAKQCPKMECFAYISTAYTNNNLKSGSRVDEKFYPFKLPGNEEIESFCERVCQMEPQEIEKLQKKVMKFCNYPNTYCVTKRMAEAMVAKYKDHVPVAIIRPSIVGAALKEPFPGWVDVVSGGGAVYFFVGLGVISLIPGNPSIVSDQVPVDFVANGMIVCPADVVTNKNKLKIYHIGTSTTNPGKWQHTVDGVLRYWHSHQPKKAIARADFYMIPNDFIYHSQFYLRYTWMIQLYGILSSLFGMKSAKRMVDGVKKMAERQVMLSNTFYHFTMNEFFYDSTNLLNAFHRLSNTEKQEFSLDMTEINWSTYFQQFCYGLQKYILKEEEEDHVGREYSQHSAATTTNMVQSHEFNFNFYNDLELIFSNADGYFKDGMATRFSREEMKQMVLHSSRVQLEVSREANLRKVPISNVEKRALSMMDKMFAQPSIHAIRVFGYMLRKIWRRIYQGIIVDSSEMEKLKQLSEKSSAGTLVFLPTHRSYVDFIILSYLFFLYGLPVPHISAGEDFLNMFLVRDLFRYSGAFFMRRSFGNDALYKSIFSEYVHRLLMDGNPIEFFVEGTRSRAGKTLRPKLGLLKTIADAYLENRVENLTLVPIHIGYERVIESESHSRELLGGSKKGESLTNLMKASSVLFTKYGDVNVKIAEPISLKDYIQELKNSRHQQHQQHQNKSMSTLNSENENFIENANSSSSHSSFDPFYNENDKEFLIKRLGSKITFVLNESAVIMPTAIVGTVLLSYRDGISMDELKTKSEWLKNQILNRGGRVHWNFSSHQSDVKNNQKKDSFAIIANSLKLLKVKSISNEKTLHSHSFLEVKSKEQKTMDLSFYRNQLTHLFYKESLIGCAFMSFGEQQVIEKGVKLEELISKCEFLTKLLSLEFIYKENQEEPERYLETLKEMEKRQLIKLKCQEHENSISSTMVFASFPFLENLKFICSLLWPIIEGYWATSMSLLSMPATSVTKQALHERIQWLIEKFYFDNKIQFYEACSMETIRNAISMFIKWNVLQTSVRVTSDKQGKKESVKRRNESDDSAGNKEEVVSLMPPYTEVHKLMEFVGEIQQFRKIAMKLSDKSSIIAAAADETPLRHSRL